MFSRFINAVKSSKSAPTPPRLLEIGELLRYKPGTRSPRVAQPTADKYHDAMKRFSEYLKLTGKDPNPFVTDITRMDYSGFHDWLATRGVKVITYNGYRVRARGIWNLLRDDYGIAVCDIRGITHADPEPIQRNHAIDDVHLTRILQRASCRDVAMILYMVDAGFRRQTVPRLTVENTHIWQRADGQFRIASHIPKEKTSAARVVMAENAAAIAVQNWLNIRRWQDSPYIFCNEKTGGTLEAKTISAIFTRLQERCRIPAWSNVCAHSLRHRFAQNKLDDNDARVVADWMGISVKTLLNVYAARGWDALIEKRFGDDEYPEVLVRAMDGLR